MGLQCNADSLCIRELYPGYLDGPLTDLSVFSITYAAAQDALDYALKLRVNLLAASFLFRARLDVTVDGFRCRGLLS